MVYRVHLGKSHYTRGGTLVTPTDSLIDRLTFKPVFKGEDPIKLYRKVGNDLLVARGAIPISHNDQRSEGDAVVLPNYFKARNPEQTRVVKEATALVKNGDSFIVQAPTGFGKTYVGSVVIANYGRRALIVVTKEDIKTQWMQALKDVCGLSRAQVGLLQGSTIAIKEMPVSIAMIQSVYKWQRYPDWVYNYFGMVLVDECHRMGAPAFSGMAFQFAAKVRMGMTATPERKDKRDIVFRSHLGPVRVKSETYPMIPKVLLIRTQYMVPPKVPQAAGRIPFVLRCLVGSDKRNARILHYMRSCLDKGRNTVVFSDRTAHLKTLAKLLKGSGIDHRRIGFYVGGLSETERDRAKRKDIVLATYKMASEATDVPWWDACIFATPKSDVVQISGRVMREYPDKPQPVIFDLIDEGSWVLDNYAKNRRKWYISIGAKMMQAR